ncbi:hypothetical protein PHISCL_04572 [Aspergillus sclerotialis]|uniref:Receptor L-domain domain-containing protein n=1 Tax=Aspergillus sclerotialis TaxID=2070753 RepID=A0A3A2ZIY8_9EURO|nr:hypothetical protein PHISCL_04572 [Aspergillus sclerotialis]
MIAWRYLVLALAVLQPVIAGNTCEKDVTISSQSDAESALSNCDTVKGTVTISKDASGSISLDNLQKIEGGLTIHGTSDLTKLSAQNLQKISYDLSVKDNGGLKDLSMQNLQEVKGNMKIEGNDNLKQLQLQNLEDVNGGLVLSGEFDRFVDRWTHGGRYSADNTSAQFQNLDQVDGQTSIRGSGDFSCSDFEKMKSDGVFEGPFSCSTGSSSSSSSSSDSSSSSSSSDSNGSNSGSSGLSAGAKGGIAVAVIVVVAIILGALWFMYKRRKAASGAEFHSVPTGAATDPEKGGGGVVGQVNDQPPSPPPPAVPAATGSIARKPIKPATEPEIPMLDSENVHEAPAVPPETRDPTQIFELDAGPVRGTHQQPINHEE